MAFKDETLESVFYNILVQCSKDRFQKLFHHLIDIFCGSQSSFYENYSDLWTLIEWWNLISGSETFFKTIQSSTKEVATLIEPLPVELGKIVKDCLEVRSGDLRRALLEKTHFVCPAYLNNFDWKLKLTLGSDKMAQINEPRLQLDLDITGNKQEFLQLDLSKEELKSLIECMEKAQIAVVDFLVNE